MILAGDIGATKTILGLFSCEAGPLHPFAEATFPSREFPGLEEMSALFLSQAGGSPIRAACFGIAGPVGSGGVEITNLPWSLGRSRLAKTLGIPLLHLINDTEALASSLSLLKVADLETLNPGIPEEGGVRAVVASGTGLGEAFLTYDNGRWRAYASEGGHADFSPSGEEQIALLRYLEPSFGHVSWERVCSGIGIRNISQFLMESGNYGKPPWSEELAAGHDITPGIVRAALERTPPCPLSVHILEMFVSLLGAEAGNLALKVLPTGGIFLGGGLSPRILSHLGKDFFMESFTAKGRMAGIMKNIPVQVILNPKAALLGAAKEGLDLACGSG